MQSEAATEIFSDVYSDAWQKDFRAKEGILNDAFESITAAEYYQRIFGSTDNACHLLLKEAGKFKTAKNFKEVEEYLADNNEVCLYLQSFKNFRPTYRNIRHCYGFVVDLDNVRSACLDELVLKISNMQYKPNILVSSGNGLHLYYLFSEPFNFGAYTEAVSMYEYVKRTETFHVVKAVYNKLADFFEGETISYKVDRTHLSQPIRMFGSTTKNINIRTAGYRVSDERLSFEDYARSLGVELMTDEMARYVDKQFEKDIDDETQDAVISVSELNSGTTTEISNKISLFDDINTTFLEYYKDNKADVRARWLEYAKRLCEEDQAVAKQFRQKTRTSSKPDISNYMATMFRIMDGAKVGHRQELLLIFCTRAAMYRVPEDKMKEDAREIMMYWNTKWPKDIVRERELESVFRNYKRYRYSNEKIKQQTGIDLEFENKREAEREKKRSIKAMNRSNMRKCAVEYIQGNRGCSYRQIADYLALNGFDASEATIKRDEVIRAAKESGE